MNNPRSGWQVGLGIFQSADRNFNPLKDTTLASQALKSIGMKLEWEEDAENGVYVVELDQETLDIVMRQGYIDLQFAFGGDEFQLTCEVDLDQIGG